MGTKVMVRASRSFNGYVEDSWYMVDPSDPSQAALIAGGYLEHQEHLFEDLAEVAGGEVEAEQGEHQADGAGEGPGAGDPHGRANPRRGKKDRPA